jgi:hypothetical protein
VSGARNHTGHRVGQWHGRSKFSDEKVAQVRKVYAESRERGAPVGYALLGRAFGMSASTARDIVKYRTRASA